MNLAWDVKRLFLEFLLIALLWPQVSRGAEESFVLPDGQKLDYFIEYPSPSTNRPSAPLCIVMGGGKGDRKSAEAAMNKLGKPLVERGMIAVSPVSPTEKSFFNEPESDWIIALMKDLQARDSISDGRILIGGLSNGGISALAIAVVIPQKIRCVMMVPGLPIDWNSGLDLRGMPIYLRIGEKDNLDWGKHYSQIVKSLTKAHAKLNARLVKNAGHGFDLDWPEIDKWLKTLAQ